MDSACMQEAPARRVLGEGSAGTRARRQAWDVHLRGGRRLEPLGASGAELPRALPGARPPHLRAGGAPPRRRPAPLARGRQPGAAHGEVGGVRTSMRDIDGGGACVWVRRGCGAAPGGIGARGVEPPLPQGHSNVSQKSALQSFSTGPGPVDASRRALSNDWNSFHNYQRLIFGARLSAPGEVGALRQMHQYVCALT